MKTPHIVQVALALVVALVAHVHVAGDVVTLQFSVPAAAATILTTILTGVGLLSDSVQTAMRQKAAKLAAMAGPTTCFVLLLGAFGCQGCQNGQLPPVVVPSVDLAVCIFDQDAATPSCRPVGNPVLCFATIANACGSDAASVEKVLTAQRKKMVADGFVLPPTDAGH